MLFTLQSTHTDPDKLFLIKVLLAPEKVLHLMSVFGVFIWLSNSLLSSDNISTALVSVADKMFFSIRFDFEFIVSVYFLALIIFFEISVLSEL